MAKSAVTKIKGLCGLELTHHNRFLVEPRTDNTEESRWFPGDFSGETFAGDDSLSSATRGNPSYSRGEMIFSRLAPCEAVRKLAARSGPTAEGTR